jgi:hypothetical protein
MIAHRWTNSVIANSVFDATAFRNETPGKSARKSHQPLRLE